MTIYLAMMVLMVQSLVEKSTKKLTKKCCFLSVDLVALIINKNQYKGVDHSVDFGQIQKLLKTLKLKKKNHFFIMPKNLGQQKNFVYCLRSLTGLVGSNRRLFSPQKEGLNHHTTLTLMYSACILLLLIQLLLLVL